MPMKTTRCDDQNLCQFCLALAREECSYCEDGYCLKTDTPCRQRLINPSYRIKDGEINCDWFLLAVLPLDHELNTAIHDIMNEERDLDDEAEDDEAHSFLRKCEDCGRFFTPQSNRQKRCKACALKAHKKVDAKWHRLQYSRI